MADPTVPWNGKNSFPGKRLSVRATIGAFADHLGVSVDPPPDEWLPDVDPNDGSRVHLTQYGDAVLLYAIAGGGRFYVINP